MADQGSLTHTDLCCGADGQSWCLSDSQGPAEGPSFQVSDIRCLQSASGSCGLTGVGLHDPAQPEAHAGGLGRSYLD